MLGKCISGIRISKILLGEDPDPPHGLRNFGARRVGLHTTWSAPQAKNPSYAPANPSDSWALVNLADLSHASHDPAVFFVVSDLADPCYFIDLTQIS